eukprot:4359658-Pyramimonas_sp.AAC.1
MAASLVHHCKVANELLPELSAAIDQHGNYDEKIGARIFSNLAAVTAGYTIHQTLSYLSRAGKLLDASPAVDEHDGTATSIATGIATMAIGVHN